MNNITENKGLIKLLGFLAVGGMAIGVLANFITGWSNNLNTMDTALHLVSKI